MTSVKAPIVPAEGATHVAALIGGLMKEVHRSLDTEERDGLRQSHHRLLGNVPPEGIRITELAARLRMTKQGGGQFVTFLTDRGYLEVLADPADKRVRIVRLTAAGRRTVKAFDERILRLEREWAQRVGPRRYATFRAVLAEIGEGDARRTD